MALTIVDSDILIDAGRGEADAINCLARLEVILTLALSAITQLELHKISYSLLVFLDHHS
jgi:predicted transcriptional regulator